MSDPSRFTNPLTGTGYRLSVDAAGTWRITKSVPADRSGAMRIRHLRGTASVGHSLNRDAVDRLVRGEHQHPTSITGMVSHGTSWHSDSVDRASAPHEIPPSLPAADPSLAFAAVVLVDVDTTSAWLTTLASQARQRRITGARGFRPGCAVLRADERVALNRALNGCRELAASWRTAGLTAPRCGLPLWLTSAIEDLAMAGHTALLPSVATVHSMSLVSKS